MYITVLELKKIHPYSHDYGTFFLLKQVGLFEHKMSAGLFHAYLRVWINLQSFLVGTRSLCRFLHCQQNASLPEVTFYCSNQKHILEDSFSTAFSLKEWQMF